jgi:pSer/pThr/pTyr-binding forkhead associated (FHA) protein
LLDQLSKRTLRWLTLVACLSLTTIVVSALAATAVHAAPTDVILVLDNSGSMRNNDPNFLLKRAVAKFVNELDQQTRVGMLVFDTDVAYPITLGDLDVEARSAIRAALEDIDYRGQFTNSPAAIERAIYELKGKGRDDASKVIIFMTDGLVDTGKPEADVEKTKWVREDLAAEAAGSDIKVFGIAFTENADVLLIQSLANKTSGAYFRALTPEDLDGVFSSVHSKLAEPPPQPAVPPPMAGSCLATLMAEEIAAMRESAAAEGKSAEQLCREMLPEPLATPRQVAPSDVVVVEDSSLDVVLIIAVAAIALLVLVVIVVVLLRRGKGASAGVEAEAAPIPDAFINDINSITGEVATKIGDKPLLIGRVAGNDPAHLDYFVVDKGTIGRRHALIQYRDFTFWVADQGSVNGTFLNGERIENERQLKHGDRVKFHKYEFEFSMPEMDEAGHTVFADPNDPASFAEATMIGNVADNDPATPPPGQSEDIFDDETATPATRDSEPDDDLFDDPTALSARSRAEVDEEEEPTGEDVFGEQTSAPIRDDDFDAEASAFFDDGALSHTSDPLGGADFSEEATALPDIPATEAQDEDTGESSTLLPGSAYVDDALDATADISLDEFMRTDSFDVPLPGMEPVDDESEDATLMPNQVGTSNTYAAAQIDDVFDLTGERTVPPAASTDDDDEDDDSEAPTEFRS